MHNTTAKAAKRIEENQNILQQLSTKLSNQEFDTLIGQINYDIFGQIEQRQTLKELNTEIKTQIAQFKEKQLAPITALLKEFERKVNELPENSKERTTASKLCSTINHLSKEYRQSPKMTLSAFARQSKPYFNTHKDTLQSLKANTGLLALLEQLLTKINQLIEKKTGRISFFPRPSSAKTLVDEIHSQVDKYSNQPR